MTFDELASKEWLLTNGIGGFASGTLAGCATRRYHSLLTVALDPPSGHRMSLLGGLDETVIIDGVEYPLATHLYDDGTIHPDGWNFVEKFNKNTFSMFWFFRLPNGVEVKKELQLLQGKDGIVISYIATAPLKLRIAPLVCWKEIHAEMCRWEGFPVRSQVGLTLDWLFQATADSPLLQFAFSESGSGKRQEWQSAGYWNEKLWHKIETERGFNGTEELFVPATSEGNIYIEQHNGKPLSTVLYFMAEVFGDERKPVQRSLLEETQQQTKGWRHAQSFVIGGGPIRTTIQAGYPWFTDWGRDTFISLPGLCLTTGREEVAKQIIRDFVPWVCDGRIPNRFPDNNDAPAYNNVDGTLWFVRCIGLCGLTEELSETVEAILTAHLTGTVGDGIFCDSDGLLRCGDDHTNLTWMDAKVDGVAITPRFDRPVEVQALWINALRVAGKVGLAKRAQSAFLERFVRADGLGLYDCLLPDGTPDAAIRPNQVIAAALLELPEEVTAAILATATEHLLTPYGLRTLSPTDSRFCPRYEGGPHQRDSVYHQGTVWPWLIGSFCDLYKKVHGADANVAPFLSELLRHQTEDYGLGGIAEVFDGAAPHRPNGCPWQAWSLAEVLRSSPHPPLGGG
ncbi:amylo-alpha-1,6-glucosidase [Armatimonas sp.]|uniref:amylo-alpha-1,6-glucosidase n=1 Tax=Armatimonas sp. TaxID=1872638 RepID=UPI00374CF5C3